MRRIMLYSMSLLSLMASAAGGRAEQGDWDDPSWQILRQAHVRRDGHSLAEYLRGLCGDGADAARIDALARQLGSADFDEREAAQKALTAAGPAALGRLRPLRNDPDAEVARRAADAATAIEAKWDPEKALAAVRVLVRRGGDEAVPALLRFLPCADAEEMRDAVWFGLDALTVRQGKVDASLVEALHDGAAVRRAAAACVVGRRGDAGQRAAVRRLLDDADAEVRLRAAQGLLAAKDAAGLPTLTALLEGTPLETAWQAEELLRYVAGSDAPTAVLGRGGADERRACRTAWKAWWKAHGPDVDFAKLDATSRRPGLTLLVDGGAADGPAGRVWLLGCDGVTRWEIRDLSEPTDARLGGGRVLIAQRGKAPAVKIPLAPPPRKGGSVGAYGYDGQSLWQYQGIDDPTTCLPQLDDDIVVAGRELAIAELDAAGKECFRRGFTAKPYSHPDYESEFGWDAVGLTRGRSETSHAYEWREADPDPRRGTWEEYTLFRGGLYLSVNRGSGVAVQKEASIVGKPNSTPNTGIYIPWIWKRWVPGAIQVGDLPNGRSLVCGLGRVLEFDAEGRAVWSVSFEDRAEQVRPCLSRVRLGFDAPRQDHDLEAPSDWLQGLASKEAAVRRRTANAIVQAGRWATEASLPLLTPLNKDADERVRDAAGRTVRLLSPNVDQGLLKAMRDKDLRVQQDAAMHLSEGRCPSKVVETLIGLLKDEDPHMRWWAANLLGGEDREEEKIIPALIEAVRDGEDIEARQMASHALGEFGKDAKAAIPALLERVKNNPDPRNSGWSMLALTEIDPLDERVFPVLIEAIQRKDFNWWVAKGLGRCKERAKEVVPLFMKVLQARPLNSKPGSLDNDSASATLQALADFGPEAKAAVPLLRAILRDKSAEMGLRASAAQALGEIGSGAKEAIPDLEEARRKGLFQGNVAEQALEKIQDD